MFDNIADLIDKIRLGEDSYLELKEVRFAGHKVSAPHKDSLADELAAFANSRGGVCVLGAAAQAAGARAACGGSAGCTLTRPSLRR